MARAKQTITITRSTLRTRTKANTQTPVKKSSPKRCPSCGKFTSK